MPRSHLPHKTDDNHLATMQIFRSLGWTVHDTHTVGNGFPDFVAGRNGYNLLVEVKRDAKAPFTKPEIAFREKWRGKLVAVWDEDSAVQAASRRPGT